MAEDNKPKDAERPLYHPGYIYSDHLHHSLDLWALLSLNKKEEGEKKFKYSKYGSWRTYLFGFTDDTKMGLNYVDHFYKNDYYINYYIPDYLSIKDTTYPALLIKNNLNINSKFRLNFDILNGNYRSEVNKYLSVPGSGHEDLLLFYKPESKSGTRIKIDNILPTKIDTEEFNIKMVELPDIVKKKNRALGLSKYYYKLKFYSGEGSTYFSKLKSPGWFSIKYRRGDDVIIRFKIKAKQALKDIRISDYIPGGLEYISRRLKYRLYKIKTSLNYGVVHKDEKITFHIPYLEKGTHNIYYILKAKFGGKYFLPGYTALKDNKLFLSYPENKYMSIE